MDQQPKTKFQELRDKGFFDNAAMAFNSLRHRPDPNIAQVSMMRQQERREAGTTNRTAQWLRANGREDLASAVEAGLDPKAALGAALQPQERGYQTLTGKQLIEQYGLEPGAIEPNALYNLSGQGQITKVGGSGTTVNFPSQPQVSGDFVIVPDPNSPAGVRMTPIPGSKAATEAAGAQQEVDARQAAQAAEATLQGDTVLSTISDIKKVTARTGVFDLPETGIVGGMLARTGLNQEAVDVQNMLATLESAVAFDRLQRMREASPTGGALGAVSERELSLLAADMGSLRQSSSKEVLMSTLDRIEKRYTDIMRKFSAYPNASEYFGAQPAQGEDPLGLFK